MKRLYLIQRLMVCIGTVSALTANTMARADTFPQRPVRMIVPFPAGGGQDITTRTIARHAGDAWGQSVVVENRAGGKTLIGAEAAARATADGYTLLMTSVEVLLNTGLIAPSSVNMRRDLAPVILCSTGVNVLAVRAGSSIKSVADLIGQARDNPGKISYGSAGLGSSSHMTAEQLMLMAKINLLHVPYKGTATSVTDAIGGQIDLIFAGAPPLLSMVQGGKLRAIAVGSRKRFPLLPDAPTFDESGLKGFEMTTFAGLMAPAKTPPAIIAHINKDIGAVLQRKDVMDAMLASGTVAMGGTPADFGKYLHDRGAILKRLIEVAKISTN